MIVSASSTKRKLKIAVLFFGHVRTFENCVESVHRHLLDLYDCDVYMHTWNWTEANTKTWHNEHTKRLPVDTKVIERLKKIYSLKDIQVDEELKNVNDILLPILSEKEGHVSSNGLKSVSTSLKRVTDLCVKSGIKYDYVVTLRPDIFLKTDLFIDKLDDELQIHPFNSSIFYAFYPSFMGKRSLTLDAAGDIIQIGKLEDISRFATILGETDFSKYQMWIPETLSKKIGQDNGLIFHALNYFYNQDWEIIRKPKKEKRKRFFKNIVRLRIRWNLLRIRFFEFLNFNLLSFETVFFEKINVEISIGKNLQCK